MLLLLLLYGSMLNSDWRRCVTRRFCSTSAGNCDMHCGRKKASDHSSSNWQNSSYRPSSRTLGVVGVVAEVVADAAGSKTK